MANDNAAHATVNDVRGIAHARDGQGVSRRLLPGDSVGEGEIIVVAPNGEVTIDDPLGGRLVLGEGLHERAFDRLRASGAAAESIGQAIEHGLPLDDLLEDPAAGLGGAGTNEGHGFVRLGRISETVGSTVLADMTAAGSAAIHDLADDTAAPPLNTAPVAADDHAALLEDTVLQDNVLANDHDVDGDPLTVTGFSVAGATYTAGTTAVIAGIGEITIAANGD
ncbi:MAG: retention module-containing protein, partial [Gallionellaceae bacterium]|nr:retention module-containing protein [Gallionellaceae bacterium]